MKQTVASRETTRRIDTLHGATAPSGTRSAFLAAGERGVSRERLAKSMSQVDSRYNGCVVFGASREKLSAAVSARANWILAAFVK
jgi:hypothetical protein